MAEKTIALVDAFDHVFPEGSSRRKALHIVGIVLFVEGLSVIALFSYAGVSIGLASLFIGFLLLLLLRRKRGIEPEKKPPPGIRLLDSVVQLFGGGFAIMVIGLILVAVVIVYNLSISSRPEFGDVDTITILLGLILLAYPVTADRFRVESAFALLFVGLVTGTLVIPQVLTSYGELSGGGGVASWYVHYMLAAPFAGVLDLLGIPATSYADMVTIQFQDGSIHTLRISAYCAGLYSFSIFLSAFIAYVLVFETIPRRILAVTLGLGVLIAYLGNILRMVVIGIVGYYYGLDALHWAHENAGWIVFLAWSASFWYVILKYVAPAKEIDEGGEPH